MTVSRRLTQATLLALGVLVSPTNLWAQGSGHSEPGAPATVSPATSTPAPSTISSRPFDGRQWSFAVLASYGSPTSKVSGLKVNPYGVGLGGDVTWTSPSGVWVGLGSTVFLGRTVTQIYEPALTTLQIEVAARSHTITIAPQVGFDLRVDPLVIRYSLDVGATIFAWDFGKVPYISIAGYSATQGTTVGLHLAPGFGVFLPLDAFYLGLEFNFRIETNAQIPGAVVGGLQAGWRL